MTTGVDRDPVNNSFQGSAVVSGIAYGPSMWAQARPKMPVPGEQVPEGARQREFEKFIIATEKIAGRLNARADVATGAAAELLRAAAVMVADPAWRREARKAVTVGYAADYAAVRATEKFTTMFATLGGRMAERIVDLEDLRDRVIAEIRGDVEPGLPVFTQPVVLFADDLSPADTAMLDPAQVMALVTVRGGRTGHTAIIARQLGIPCVVGVGKTLHKVHEGQNVLVDGGTGIVRTEADPLLAQALVKGGDIRSHRLAQWRGPAQTRDGHRITLLGSVTSIISAQHAATSPAEGIGLFRTEVPFLNAREEPTVVEQARLYQEVLRAFPGRRVVFRTFDAGSDKPLSFANLPTAENPALGVRGLRVAWDQPRLLTNQLDAIAQAGAATAADPWVMAPMLTTPAEAEWFSGLCRDRGLIPGAMIEVPAAALMADLIMPQLSFVSIGTNDLTQYVMAADRMSPELSEFADPWQPAVLRLIQHTCREGQRLSTDVGVCGEAAADPVLACVLVGLGVNSLSPAVTAIAEVGLRLSEVSLAACQRAARAAVRAGSAPEAKAMAEVELWESEA
ncbi:phosphoenolpyruvate--protein phosphotransferase [Corynebacterium sp. A21]|uniref:phosphoenolpyruvate--protein phosphotransferase n=1 Tax=Corynebacterium sp. A21 TaxID=3457318 RepID=UPI003FD4F943